MRDFLLFKIGDQTFAYPTEEVDETIKVTRIFPVPLAPSYIKGVINLRNRVIPIVDGGRLLWDRDTESDTAIILKVKGESVGLLVEKVLGIAEVEEEAIRSKEEIEIADVREDLVGGLFERDSQVVFIMTLSEVIKPRERKKTSRRESRASTREQKEVVREQEGFVIFGLGREWYALPVGEVREIVNYPETVSRIPQAPHYVEGVFILRKEELILISLKSLLDVPSEEEERRVIVAHLGSTVVGLGVDEVKEIRWVDKEEILYMDKDSTKGVLVLDEGKRLALIVSVKDLLREEEIEDLTSSEEEAEGQEEVANMKSFVHFTVGDTDLAIPIGDVKEVIEVEELTPLPKAPDYIEGMYNLRNSVIAIVSLSKLLGIKNAQDANRVVVLESFPVGLMVSTLRGILKVKEESIQPVEEIAGIEENMIEGMIKTEDGGIIFILNTKSMVKEEDIEILSEQVR